MNCDKKYVCIECFADTYLLEFIETKGTTGDCSWCGSKSVKTVPVHWLSEMFRAVADCYEEVLGTDAYLHSELISFLLQDDWTIFSDKIDGSDLMQKMTLAILKADIGPKEKDDYPDYNGFFERQLPDLVDEWFDRLENLLNNSNATSSTEITDIHDGFPSRLELATEDGMRALHSGDIYWRARVHKDRKRKERFAISEMGGPPSEETRAGRANKEKEPVLYLATDYKTAIAEVRSWRGMALAVAKVRLIRDIRVLDLIELRYPKSPFGSEFLCYDLQVLALFHSFGSALSTPLVSDNEKHLYLPSQKLCDFVREHGAEGILYRSAMGAGNNLVIFDPNAGEPISVDYYRINTPEFFPEPIHERDDIYDNWPYAHLIDG